MYTIIIVLLVLYILLVMPIQIKVTYDDKKNDVDFIFIKFFNLHLDLEDVLRFLLTTKDRREKITLEGLIYNFTILIKSKKILKLLFRLSIIKKITMIAYENYENPFIVVNTWTLLSQIKNITNKYFYKVRNEYYMVTNNEKFNFSFQVVVEVRIILAILAIIFNIKDLFKILKFMKVYYGKSDI